MSRVEEQAELILPDRISGNIEDCKVKVEMAKMNYIYDISKSLAVMADACNAESDYYMHDMQLINYILNRYLVTDTNGIRVDIEDVYEGWRRLSDGK